MNRTLLSCLCLAAALSAAAVADAATATTPAASTRLAIIVYDQPNFKGRSLTLAQATPDLKAHGFDDRIASLSISGAGDWVLCEHKNYTGRCVRVQGQAQDLKLLQVGGRVSSLYPVPASAAAPTP